MYVDILKKISPKREDRCVAISMFTSGETINDIRIMQSEGKNIILVGNSWYMYFLIQLFDEIDIEISTLYHPFLSKAEGQMDGVKIIDSYDFFDNKDQIYPIVATREFGEFDLVRKQFLLHGITKFAVLSTDLIFDFDSSKIKNFKQLFLETINDVYHEKTYLDDCLNEMHYHYLNPIKWWYDTMDFVVSEYVEKDKFEKIKLLDVGPGVGIESILYKKILDCKLNWINLPSLKQVHKLSQDNRLIEKYDVNVQYGYIENDSFEGKYDLIIFTDIIEHMIYNPLHTVNKLKNMLSENGKIVISTPNAKKTHNYLNWRDMPDPPESYEEGFRITNFGHVFEFNENELDDLFRECGLKTIYKKVSSKLQYVLEKRDKL